MPINKDELTKELVEKAVQCKETLRRRKQRRICQR